MFDTYTKLVIHFNGSNGQTTYTAETGQTITFVGTAQLATAQKKFGSASLLLDGDSDYVTVPDSADWDFGATFTIDAWVKTSASGLGTAQQSIVGRDGYPTFPTQRAFNFYVADTTGKLAFTDFNATLTGTTNLFTSGGWHHVAVVCNAGTGQLYIDGVAEGSTESLSIADITLALWIGNSYYSTFFNGYIDEPHISKGIARWTANFTPPTHEYGFEKYQSIIL